MRVKGINIPIVTTYDPKGSKKAETGIQKFTKFASGAFAGLAAAAGAAAVAYGVEAVKAAASAQAAEKKFALTLKNSTKATDKQVAAMEDYIEKTQFASGVNDDDLRNSVGTLVRVTKDQTKAQELNNLAMDISAGTGKDLGTVSLALAKAYGGNMGSLTRLGVQLDESIVKNKDFNAAQQELTDLFGGQSAAAADTFEGKLKRLNERWGEMQEEVGALLLEHLEPLMDWIASPEGGKVIEDFAKAFAAAIKMAAEALPGIFATLKKIGGVASGLGIDPSKFMNPQMMAAATAFRLTPGPVQIKALAAIAAYAAFGQNEGAQFDSKRKTLSVKTGRNVMGTEGIDYGSYFQGTFSGAVAQGNYMYGQTGATKNTNAPQYQINISGAIDPEMTARQLDKILKQSGARAGSYR